MKKFKISKEALLALSKQIESSGSLNPVMSLLDSCATPMTSLSMVRLDSGVYEYDDCRPEAVVDIDGINFNLPNHILNALEGYTLDIELNRLILISKHNKFKSLYDFMNHEFSNAYGSN